MKEKKFSRFVQDLEDCKDENDPRNRKTIENLIGKIRGKQTRMKVKGKWNFMIPRRRYDNIASMNIGEEQGLFIQKEEGHAQHQRSKFK